MHTSDNNATWQQILEDLKLQMTEATFDTWLRDSRIAQQDGDRITIAVKNEYALDWLESRLKNTVLRTAARITGRPVDVRFVVSDNGHQPEQHEADTDAHADCRVAIEVVNFDITVGFVMTSNYAWQYWQPYLGVIEREHGARNLGVAFALWNTLRSFPASWQETARPHWPSLCTLADMTAGGNRFKITGREAHGQRYRRRGMVGALEILEAEHIVWPRTVGTGRETVYWFRVLDTLPVLTPAQISKLSRRLQERHERELERRQLDLIEWQQLALPTLLEDR